MPFKKRVAIYIRWLGILIIAVSIFLIAYIFIIGKPGAFCWYSLVSVIYAGPVGVVLYAVSGMIAAEDRLKMLSSIGLLIVSAGFEIAIFMPETKEFGPFEIRDWFMIFSMFGGLSLFSIAKGIRDSRIEEAQKSTGNNPPRARQEDGGGVAEKAGE